MAKPVLIDVHEEDGLLVHRFRDPETGEEWEEAEEPLESKGLEDFDQQRGINQDQPSEQEQPEPKKKVSPEDEKKQPQDKSTEGKMGDKIAGDKAPNVSDLESLKEDPKEYFKEKAKQELKNTLKKEAEEKGGELLVETFPEWGPVVGGCLVIIVLAVVVFGGFMTINTDSGYANEKNAQYIGTSSNKIVQAAIAEYNLDPRPRESGGSNCGVDKYTLGSCEPWCADFVSYVLKQAGTPFSGGLNGGYRLPAVDSVDAWFRGHNLFIAKTNAPLPGDVVIYNEGGGYSHVNIVIEVKGNQITTIGGNESNTITKSTRTWVGNKNITGFGRMK